MLHYADSSALLKRYLDEPDSDSAREVLERASLVATSRLTLVEVRRNLSRVLRGADLLAARDHFTADVRRMALLEADAVVCEMAAATAETTGMRSLDAIHVASALRLASSDLVFVTYDPRQAAGARSVGLTVVGA